MQKKQINEIVPKMPFALINHQSASAYIARFLLFRLFLGNFIIFSPFNCFCEIPLLLPFFPLSIPFSLCSFNPKNQNPCCIQSANFFGTFQFSMFPSRTFDFSILPNQIDLPHIYLLMMHLAYSSSATYYPFIHSFFAAIY